MLEKTIKLEDIKKLDIEDGDTIVMLGDKYPFGYLDRVGQRLNCKVVAVKSLDDIGILKTSKFKKQYAI